MNQIKSFVLQMLVLLMFAPISSTTTSYTDSQITLGTTSINSKSANHSQSDLPLAYEEREKEEESCGQQKSKQSLVYTIAGVFTLMLPFAHSTLFSFVHSRLTSMHAHLYIVERSLRI